MGRLQTPQLTPVRMLVCVLAAIVLLASSPSVGQSSGSAAAATLCGTVRDSQGKPVAAATVSLRTRDGLQTLSTRADAQGNYVFPSLQEGVYAVRAEMAGYGDAAIPSVFLAPKEVKTLDLTLGPVKSPALSPSAPEFFDQPQFTVSGVTDTTNLGGHGSDAVVRTRETLAKETTSLGKTPAASAPPAATPTEDSLREEVKRDPGNFGANHQLGRILIASGRASEAIPYLERAADTNPGDYENACDLALAHADAGNYARARDLALTLLQHHDSAEWHHLLGDLQEKLGNSLEAVREFERAAELDPTEAYLFDWGSELLLHHAPEPAVEVFTKGNRLFPRSVRMLIGLGAAYFAHGSDDLAVQRICQASDLSPNDAAPYLFLGRIETAEMAPPDALVEKLHRFVTLQPENAEANYYYALALWKQSKNPREAARAAQAESLLNKAVRLDPGLAAAYLQLGILHAEQGDFAKAVSDYQHALQGNPQLGEAHYRLAQVYRQTGETDKARAELRIYDQMAKESAQKVERERHEIRQFVYTLRDRAPAQTP